jgi:NAD+ synthase
VFNKDILKIDTAEVSTKIEDFIRDSVKNFFRRKGIVIGLSGGIDSSVAAALSVRALGKEWVYGLLLPERDSNPVSREYGIKMAELLEIQYHEVDISTMLEAFGVYEKRDTIVRGIFPELQGSFKFRIVLPQDLLDRDRLNVYHIEVLTENGSVLSKRLKHDQYLELMAANDIKQRARMTQLYYEAEKRHYIVSGTTNRSEVLQGFFVKFGDGGVDIEPACGIPRRAQGDRREDSKSRYLQLCCERQGLLFLYVLRYCGFRSIRIGARYSQKTSSGGSRTLTRTIESCVEGS